MFLARIIQFNPKILILNRFFICTLPIINFPFFYPYCNSIFYRFCVLISYLRTNCFMNYLIYRYSYVILFLWCWDYIVYFNSQVNRFLVWIGYLGLKISLTTSFRDLGISYDYWGIKTSDTSSVVTSSVGVGDVGSWMWLTSVDDVGVWVLSVGEVKFIW